MRKHRKVLLTNDQRGNLEELVDTNDVPDIVKTKARILLMTDRSKGHKTLDAEIIDSLGISICTIIRTRKKICEKGLDAAINRVVRSHRKPKFDTIKLYEAIISTIQNPPPMNNKRWTIRLVTDQISAIEGIGTISNTRVYQILKKLNINLK